MLGQVIWPDFMQPVKWQSNSLNLDLSESRAQALNHTYSAYSSVMHENNDFIHAKNKWENVFTYMKESLYINLSGSYWYQTTMLCSALHVFALKIYFNFSIPLNVLA